METAVYIEGGVVNQGSTLEPYVSAMLPLLIDYGVRVSPLQQTRLRDIGADGQPTHATLGDAYGVHLTVESVYDSGCGYDTPATYLRLSGTNLIHLTSGTRLSFFISIIDYIYPPSRITVRVETDEGQIEAFKNALNLALNHSGFRQP